MPQCHDTGCASSDQIRALAASDVQQSLKIDKLLSILTDSTLDGGSVVDRLRKCDAEIKELKRTPPPTLLSIVVRKSVETVTQAVWAGLFLLLTRGFFLEVLSKGHP